jgi:murein DD-endopeptidase MepM/ murein hydrolase activator NlpD
VRHLKRFEILQGKVASAERILADIKHRDQYVYRPLLGVDTLNIPAVYSDYLDSKYEAMLEDEYYGEVTIAAWKRMDRLMRSIYYSSLALDTTQKLAENKEEYSSIIPAIWPIDRTKLKNVSSLYGMRNHPTLGIWRMHEGVDLTAPIGTSVYATGNGTVSQSQVRNGYGELIEIDHGFGYKTRYAHLSARFVKPGDKVTRGQVIGEVGNTGVSDGPHLHYEVRFRDNTVNPIHYFNKDMSPEAYVELMNQIEKSS